MKKLILVYAIILMCTIPMICSAQETVKIDSTTKDSTNAVILHLQRHNAVLSSNVLELLLKGPNVMYEQVINGTNGITAKIVYDITPEVNLIYLESSYRWYVWQPGEKRPLAGLYGAPFLKMTQQFGGDKLFTFGLGGEVGFKWIWYNHYEFEPAAVYSYPFGFDLHLGFGYAF